ncbi:hemolysin III family protein [Longispora sp. NPDC051575]|uniref:PAQR family membrane homeostasis protein TrhA n=1 Tax=Longispora sp. NPDC051575 TaxID=3154943 RepID=UPI003446D5BF
MTTQVSPPAERFIFHKPRARGWLHVYAFFTAIVCGIVLTSLAATRPGWAPLVATGIYCLTICGLFGVSALYHRRWWTHRGFKMMRRLDHSMIFVFIAGTYTPFSVLLLPKSTATVILSVVWGGALAGVALKMAWPDSPRWLAVPLYIALGWVAVFALPTFLSAGGVTLLVLLAVGGAAYTVGGVLYALKRPNPWPDTFGHHEFFHACTLVAALAHHIAVYFALYA